MSSSIFNHSTAFVLRSSACPKGPSPATSSGSSNSPALSTAFVTPTSSSSSSVNFGVNLKYLPVQELVEMIHSERERTAAVERELEQVQCLSRTSDQELRVAKEEALRELTALQNQMDVFKRAELRIKSLGIEEYQDNVLLRLAAAIRDGKLDRTMDMHMLVALAHNAPLERNSRQRHFGNELMRFFVYVFGMRSAKAAHRALTARHEGSADAANAQANLINLPSVVALRNDNPSSSRASPQKGTSCSVLSNQRSSCSTQRCSSRSLPTPSTLGANFKCCLSALASRCAYSVP